MLEFYKLMKTLFNISVNKNDVYDLFTHKNIDVYHLIIRDLDTGQIIRKQISKKQYEELSILLAQNNIAK